MAWLTPERRKAIYGIAGALAIALTAFGVVSTDDMLRILAAVTGVLAGLTNFMAFLKTNVDTGTPEVAQAQKANAEAYVEEHEYNIEGEDA